MNRGEEVFALGYPCGLDISGSSTLSTGIISAFRQIESIDYIQTSDENGYEKPHISMFHSIINKMKIPSENILMIGDNYEHDIEPAIELGLIPFLFKKDYKNIMQVCFLHLIFLHKYLMILLKILVLWL